MWTYDANRMKPKMSAIRRLARERKLDGVVMAWGDTPDGWGLGFVGENPKNPVFLYMIDVERGKLYLRKGTFADVGRMSQQVFSDFLKIRPQVIASVKRESVPRPTQPAPQTTPYRIAIFPFEGTGCVGQNRPTDEKFAAELGALIAKNGSLKLAYSYYDKVLNQPPIRKPGQLWAGSRPNVARVSSLGEAHRVDAVVTYWRPSTGIGYCTDRMPPYPIHVYIIDTQRKTYWLKGREKNVSGLTEQAFSKFIAARPPAVASVKRESVPPPSQPIGAQAGDWTINYCKDLTVDQFNKAARWAFNNRGFVIEEDTPSSLTGAQKGKKVEVSMTTPGVIVIRWVPGFGYEKDNWLKSVKYDVLWGLAGAAQTGEWTINWCKDLTVDEFHKAAKWAFQKRRYIVDDDTPSSLTGALKGRRVEVSMTAPGQIVIRWVPGFGYEKDNWLKNLWRDVSVALAEQAFQTASSGSPFEGITLRPVGSVQAINAAAKAYCGKFNKRSRLIAAPPDNPEYVFRCYRPTEAVSAPTPPPTTTAKAAPAIQKGTVSRPYRIGIFPAAGDFGYGNRGTQEEQTADLLRAQVRTSGPFVLAYSYYHDDLSEPKIKARDRVWVDAGIRKKPNLDQIYRLARERNLSAVVMAWGDSPDTWGAPGGGTDSPGNPVFLYMVDVQRQGVNRRKGTFADVRRMSQQVFADFLKNRSQVLQAQATPPPTTLAKAAPATQPDKERELLRSIAGEWRGDGISTSGTAYSITYIFKEDGSFDISWRWGTNEDRGQYPPGTLRVIGSHFEHKNPDGRLWTITLHKDKKGRRRLKGRRQDGNKWELKEQK